MSDDTWTKEVTAIDTDGVMIAPSVTVIGKLSDGKLIKADWNGTTTQMSDRTLNAIQKLGVTVNDDENRYLF